MIHPILSGFYRDQDATAAATQAGRACCRWIEVTPAKSAENSTRKEDAEVWIIEIPQQPNSTRGISTRVWPLLILPFHPLATFNDRRRLRQEQTSGRRDPWPCHDRLLEAQPSRPCCSCSSNCHSWPAGAGTPKAWHFHTFSTFSAPEVLERMARVFWCSPWTFEACLITRSAGAYITHSTTYSISSGRLVERCWKFSTRENLLLYLSIDLRSIAEQSSIFNRSNKRYKSPSPSMGLELN